MEGKPRIDRRESPHAAEAGGKDEVHVGVARESGVDGLRQAAGSQFGERQLPLARRIGKSDGEGTVQMGARVGGRHLQRTERARQLRGGQQAGIERKGQLIVCRFQEHAQGLADAEADVEIHPRLHLDPARQAQAQAGEGKIETNGDLQCLLGLVQMEAEYNLVGFRRGRIRHGVDFMRIDDYMHVGLQRVVAAVGRLQPIESARPKGLEQLMLDVRQGFSARHLQAERVRSALTETVNARQRRLQAAADQRYLGMKTRLSSTASRRLKNPSHPPAMTSSEESGRPCCGKWC